MNDSERASNKLYKILAPLILYDVYDYTFLLAYSRVVSISLVLTFSNTFFSLLFCLACCFDEGAKEKMKERTTFCLIFNIFSSFFCVICASWFSNDRNQNSFVRYLLCEIRSLIAFLSCFACAFSFRFFCSFFSLLMLLLFFFCCRYSRWVSQFSFFAGSFSLSFKYLILHFTFFFFLASFFFWFFFCSPLLLLAAVQLTLALFAHSLWIRINTEC